MRPGAEGQERDQQGESRYEPYRSEGDEQDVFNPPAEAAQALEKALSRHLKSTEHPPDRTPAEWRDECLGELWTELRDILRTYQPDKGGLYRYVYCAARNHLQSYTEQEIDWWKRRRPLGKPVPREEGEEAEREPVDERTIGWERQVELRVDVHRALMQLPARDRYLFWQVEILGRSQAEAAREMGLSQGRVSQKLKEIRAFLRRQFGDEDSE
ncbi:MAG: hypothetical protein KatS3mg019_2336 [Fimbriimonadales bacterium]|nr:MAG: hypothetical protein KatS3mg019_2336 [Fimbriimonadales bacterium]